MLRHTREAKAKHKTDAAMTTDEVTAILLTIQRRLRLVQGEVDRLTLKERIDSLAARVAELEARHG